MLVWVCVWVEMVLAPSKIGQLAMITPTVISYLQSPVIIVLRISSDPAPCRRSSAPMSDLLHPMAKKAVVTCNEHSLPEFIAMAPESALTPQT